MSLSPATNAPAKRSLLRVVPRFMQILRVLVRHKFLGAVRGKKHWPSPKEVRETFEELGLTFIKFGQVLAMGTGTDVAMQSAGITLVKGDLRGIAKAIRLSRATMRNIRQNVFFAFIYNALGIPVTK